jgi:hypothetical protein
MAHDTTGLTQVRAVIPRPPRAAVAPAQGLGGPCVDVDGQRFRVRTPRFATQWLPDTPSNRHLTVVW